MGSEVLLHINSNNASFRTVQSRSHKIKVGEKIYLKPKKSQVHLFNSDGKVIAHG